MIGPGAVPRPVMAALVVATMLAVGADSAAAQQPRLAGPVTRIGDAPSCRTCHLIAVPVGQLGGNGGDVDDAGGFVAMQALPDGSIAALPFRAMEVWKLARDGRIIARFGRAGEGPGEFRRPLELVTGAGDSLYVFDNQLARVSVWTAAGAYVRTFHLPNATDAFLPIGGDAAFVAGHVYGGTNLTQLMSAFPLHFVRNDSVQFSFGTPIRRIDAREPFQFSRFLVGYHGSVLALHHSYQYAVDEWDPTGHLVRRFIREPSWFTSFTHFAGASPDTPPSPAVAGAWLEGDQLWIVVSRAAPTWREAFAKQPTRGEGGQVYYQTEHPELRYQSVVDVIDLRRRALVASMPLPFEVGYVLGHRLVGERRYDGKTGDYVRLYELRQVR